MQVFRQRAKSHGKKVDFANYFCTSAELPFVFMGFLDIDKMKFVETWTGRDQDFSEECTRQLVKTIEMRLAVYCGVQQKTPDAGADRLVPQDEILWIDGDAFLIGVGEGTGRLAPVIAFQRGANDDQPARQALYKIGMAYVAQQLNEELFSHSLWHEGVFETATQVLSIDFIVVNDQGEIVHDGRKSDVLPKYFSETSQTGGRIAMQFGGECTELLSAVNAATSDEKKTSIVSIISGDGVPRLLLITPLTNSNPPRALILFESEQTDHEEMREHIFDLYGLTRSERQVAHGIICGRTVAETAEASKLSVATVRSYIKQIFAKTGTRRQSELIMLYYSTILPVASGVGSHGQLRQQ